MVRCAGSTPVGRIELPLQLVIRLRSASAVTVSRAVYRYWLLAYLHIEGSPWLRQARGLLNLVPSGDVITDLNIIANTQFEGAAA